jgi:hypothetical protein
LIEAPSAPSLPVSPRKAGIAAVALYAQTIATVFAIDTRLTAVAFYGSAIFTIDAGPAIDAVPTRQTRVSGISLDGHPVAAIAARRTEFHRSEASGYCRELLENIGKERVNCREDVGISAIIAANWHCRFWR